MLLIQVQEAPPRGDGAQNSSSGTDIFCESQFLTSTASKRVGSGTAAVHFLLENVLGTLNLRILLPWTAEFSHPPLKFSLQ